MEAAMVTTKIIMSLLKDSEEIVKTSGKTEDVVRDVLEAANTVMISRRRQPSPTPPAGYISLSEGARKYDIVRSTLQGWAESELLKPLLKTRYRVYVEEDRLAILAKAFLKKPGRGRRTVYKKFKPQSAT
jgi:hypothetical protein